MQPDIDPFAHDWLQDLPGPELSSFPGAVTTPASGAKVARARQGWFSSRWALLAEPQSRAWLGSTVVHVALLVVLASIHLVSEFGPQGISLVAYEPDGAGELELDALPELDMPLSDYDSFVDASVGGDENVMGLSFKIEDVPADLAEAMRIDPAFSENSREPVAGGDGAQLSARMTDGRVGERKAKLLAKYGGSTETEAAVERGLLWLVKQQQSDGSWSFVGPYAGGASFRENSNSATSMALLAFLGAGHTHRNGKFRKEIQLAMDWLCEQQAKDGSFIAGTPMHHSLYTQAQACLALCEAYAMTDDATLRSYCEKATKYLLRAQGPEGGWRYEFRGESDTSVTGWCLIALMSAKSAGIEVPVANFRRITVYLGSVDSGNGGLYAYRPRMPPTPTMTAEGLLCRMYLGWARDTKGLDAGIKKLASDYPLRGAERSYYYWYYATQVMHHAGGKEWERWNALMKPQLLALQIPEGAEAGSWTPADRPFDRSPGRLYATCMSLYCLEVYYRHMPIYDVQW